MRLIDKDLGEILVRKNPFSKHLSATISSSGNLLVTAPTGTPTFFIERFIKKNKDLIKSSLNLPDASTKKARDYKEKLRKKSAREYLPYRLAYLAKLYGYSYDKCRLTSARTRWGSCSSKKTISLNIALMDVPEPLRDYVIIHELAHLSHMDHSKAFWAEVESHDKDYKIHRKSLKSYSTLSAKSTSR